MKKYISKKDFNYLLLKLLTKLNDNQIDEFGMVLGIRNGGLNVSRPIANFFNKIHRDVHISFYDDGEEKLDTPIINIYDLPLLNSLKEKKYGKFLLVDDIIDSGSTLKWFVNETNLIKGKDFNVATIHWCQENSPDLEPEFFIDKKDKSDWIYYPWEFV